MNIAIGLFLSSTFLPLYGMLCNGYKELCTKRYNEVAYAATHNGHSHKECDVHNQDHDISEQLKNGIRALKIHIWYDVDKDGKQKPFVCHGVDKKFLYDAPLEKFMDQVPFFYKPFATACLEKMKPMQTIATKAFEVAYGKDNSTGLVPFHHCIFDPAARPLLQALAEIKTFLDAHPHEVITLILEDHTNNSDFIAQDFMQSGLNAYLHTQDITERWPLLAEMIKQNKRLVVFVHSEKPLNTDKYPWMHNMWDFGWDTKWEFKTPNDLQLAEYDTIPNRGTQAYTLKNQPNNKIFVVHHFVTELMGGNKAQAKKVNKKQFLRSRLQRLAQQAQHLPTIIQVDFYQYPNNDLFDVVNELNGVGLYAGKPLWRNS